MVKSEQKKVKRYVKCNGIVRQFTYARLRMYTYMSPGEVFDRVIEGKGIISIFDQNTLDLAQKLKKLLRKVNIQRSVNEEFWSFLQESRESYSVKLDDLINTLEQGSPLIHHRDVALTEKLRTTVDKEYVDHFNEQRAFKKVLMKLFRDKGFWTGFEIEPIYSTVEYTAFIKSYYNKIKKETKDDHEIKQKVFRAIFKDLRLLLAGGRKIIYPSAHKPETYFDKIDSAEEEIVEGLYQSHLLHLRFDDRYTFYTAHPEKLNSRLFRDIIEYIHYIPSKSTPEILWQLTTDINLLEKTFPKWKLELKNNRHLEPEDYGTRLINKYKNVKMKNFRIPSLTYSILDLKFPNCERVLPWWKYRTRKRPILIAHGMLICGIQGAVHLDMSEEFEEEWNKTKESILSYKFSDDEDKKLLYKFYKKYREAFLIPHFFPKLNIVFQYESIWQNLWRIRPDMKFKLYNSIFMSSYRANLMHLKDDIDRT